MCQIAYHCTLAESMCMLVISVRTAAAGYEDTKGFSASLMISLAQEGCSGWRRAHGVTQEFGTVAAFLATTLRPAVVYDAICESCIIF